MARATQALETGGEDTSAPSGAARAGIPMPRSGVLLAAVLALVAATYAGALRGPFVWDDQDLILRQPKVVQLQSLSSYFAVEGDMELAVRALGRLKQMPAHLEEAIQLEEVLAARRQRSEARGRS
jgi:hypothetical protein